MPAPRQPQVCQERGVTVVTLGPEYENLDEPALDEVKQTMLDVSQNADPPRVVLDLSHTKFFGSAFIEILFRSWNRLNAREGGKFGISGLTPYCAEVLEVTHLDRLWNIFGTREEAVNALNDSSVQQR